MIVSGGKCLGCLPHGVDRVEEWDNGVPRQDIFEALKPGVRESDIVALAHKRLFEMGSEFVEAINSIAGERCSPHPHVFSDRLIRPGDQAYFDIIHVYNGYRTCYYRTFVVGRASQAQRDAFKQSREWMDAAIDLVEAGGTEALTMRKLAAELGISRQPLRDALIQLELEAGEPLRPRPGWNR